jgi:TRAP-type C4-dicarboxylate transport system substrate-binding protein
VLKYATIFPGGFYSSSFGFFMNQDKWNKLSKQDQDIIEKHAGEYAARSNGQSWDRADQLGLQGLKAAGAKIDTAPPAFVKAVMAQAKTLDDEWIASANAKGVDGKKVLAEFRQELKKVAAGK